MTFILKIKTKVDKARLQRLKVRSLDEIVVHSENSVTSSQNKTRQDYKAIYM